MEFSVGLDLLQTGFVAGIFWRMGVFNSALGHVTDRIVKIEGVLKI